MAPVRALVLLGALSGPATVATAQVQTTDCSPRANFNNRVFIAQTMQGEQRSFYTTNGGQSWSAMPLFAFAARYNPYGESG